MGIGRSAGKRRCLCLHRECALGAASPPVGGALSRILAHCAPYIAKSATPAMTRPVAAGNAHTGRTAALSGPHRLEVGCGRSPARINFKKQRKRKGTVGFKSGQHRAAASARVTPFCSHGNESIQGEWPAAALRVGYRPVVLTTYSGSSIVMPPTRARARHSASFEMRRRAGPSGWQALWVD
jgi:hypothetical protein